MSVQDYRIVWLIRRLFRALAEESEAKLSEHGISVADRAVMEFLYREKTLTVPAIAQRYQVSRQHVQVTVNELLAMQLVRSSANPRHKRSPLISLTSTGRELFSQIISADHRTVEELFDGTPRNDRLVTIRTLECLLKRITEEKS